MKKNDNGEALKSLIAQRDELLQKIGIIEESCEGIENKNNAAKVQKLNLERVQLSGEKQDLTAKLQGIDARLSSIATEITALSGTGLDKILAAIQNQRWYFFKNKPNVMLDKFTGYLWPNLINFPWKNPDNQDSYPSYSSASSKITALDGFKGWEVPKASEFGMLLGDGSYPFKEGDHYRIMKCYPFFYNDGGTVRVLDLDDLRVESGKSDGLLIIRSGCLIYNTNYSSFANPSSNNYNAKEKAQLTLSLFINNNLVPVFSDSSITDIFEQIYVRKPRLLEELTPIQEQIRTLQEVTLLSSEFDYRNLLAKYDLEAISNSIIKYIEAVQDWCDELIDKLNYYEEQKQDSLQDFYAVCGELSKAYEDQEVLDFEENQLFGTRQQYLMRHLSWGMVQVKDKLINVREQADTLENRIAEIEESEEYLYELGELEKQARVSFPLLAENTGKFVKDALLKIEYYEEHKELVKKLIQLWKNRETNYLKLKEQQELLKTTAAAKKIAEGEAEAWCIEWNSYRVLVEHSWDKLVSYCLQHEVELKNTCKDSALEQFAAALDSFNTELDNYFSSKRLEDYIMAGKKDKYGLQDKLLECEELANILKKLQIKLTTLCFDCGKEEQRVALARIFYSIYNQVYDALRSFVLNNGIEIESNVLRSLSALYFRPTDGTMHDLKTALAKIEVKSKELKSILDKIN